MRTLLKLSLLFCVIGLVGCNKDEDEPATGTGTGNGGGTNSPPTAVVFDNAPADGATGVSAPLTISWLTSVDAEGDAITYDIYLGTNQGNLTLASADQTGLSFSASVLELGATYYFKVDAKSGTHVTSSETRSFQASNTGTFTDTRDGQAYGTILIGNQVWMTENLKYNSSGSYSYNNTASNDATYGRLYEWSAVTGATPAGWHLPTDIEWKTLETELGMPAGDLNISDYSTPRGTNQGTQLKIGGSSNLNFPLAGYYSNGTYQALMNRTYLWVNTDAGGGNIFRRRLEANSSSCFRFTNPAGGFAVSIRLVKD